MIAGLEGVTVTDTSVGGPIVSIAMPLIDPEPAAMVVVPTVTPLASPAAETVAIAGAEELHVTDVVTFCEEPSLKVPAAVNCCFVPSAIDWFAGVTAIDTSTAGLTVRVAEPLTPADVAAIVVLPTLTPATVPLLETVATAGDEELQVTVVVRF